MLTAQDSINSDQTKQQASVQTAQSSVDSANSALAKSQASLQNTVAQQNATLQTSQNSVDSANAALQTQQATAASNTAGPTEAQIDTANAQVANAQSGLQTAQNNLSAATLTAPASGTVESLSGAIGQWVSGGATSSTSSATTTSTTTTSGFITLADLTTPQISASVSEADIGKIQPGQKVNFTLTAYPNRTFTGIVAAIVPAGTTSSNVVTYTVLVTVDPTDVQMLPSMTATLTIVTQSADNTVAGPELGADLRGWQRHDGGRTAERRSDASRSPDGHYRWREHADRLGHPAWGQGGDRHDVGHQQVQCVDHPQHPDHGCRSGRRRSPRAEADRRGGGSVSFSGSSKIESRHL